MTVVVQEDGSNQVQLQLTWIFDAYGPKESNQADCEFQLGRDGFPADPSSIYLSAGASSGVNTLLHIICATPQTGVLVPIPQYPLYTATLAVLNAKVVPYNLDEDKAWGTNLDVIKAAYKKATDEGIDTRAIVIINPGNPTGSSLAKEEIKDVIKFAAEKKLVVMADEVYQTNVFIGKFTSFKKVLRELQKSEPGKYDNVELASLHSVSKGMVGECGHRGGYYELVGFDPEVVAQIYKFVSIQLCPPVIGQCIVECMTHPPVEGEPSYELYKKEYDGIFEGLKTRANALYEVFKGMEGVSCQSPAVSFLHHPSPASSANISNRVPCTYSLQLRFQRKQSQQPKKQEMLPTNSTVSNFSMPPVFALSPEVDLAKRKERFISALHSLRQARIG
jgi:alanine transaminase